MQLHKVHLHELINVWPILSPCFQAFINKIACVWRKLIPLRLTEVEIIIFVVGACDRDRRNIAWPFLLKVSGYKTIQDYTHTPNVSLGCDFFPAFYEHFWREKDLISPANFVILYQVLCQVDNLHYWNIRDAKLDARFCYCHAFGHHYMLGSQEFADYVSTVKITELND